MAETVQDLLPHLTDGELLDLIESVAGNKDHPHRRKALAVLRDELERRQPLWEAAADAAWERMAADAKDDPTTFVHLPGERLTAEERAKLRWFFDIWEPKE